MSARWMAAALLAWPLAACAAASGQARGAQTEAQRLEKFAVSQCLMRAFPDTPVAADARRASAGYVELGSAPEEVYGQIVEVVQAYRAKQYRSKSGESLHVMQCLDLPDDPALRKLVEPFR